MRKILLSLILFPSISFATYPIIGYVQISTGGVQSGGFNTQTGTVSTMTILGQITLQDGTIIRSTSTLGGSGGGGGGSSSSSGTVVAAPQYSVAFYSQAGSTNIVSGSTILIVTLTSATVNGPFGLSSSGPGLINFTEGSSTSVSGLSGIDSLWGDSGSHTLIFFANGAGPFQVVGSSGSPTNGDVAIFNGQGFIGTGGGPPIIGGSLLQQTTVYANVLEAQNGLYLGYTAGTAPNYGIFYGSGSYVINDPSNFYYDSANVRLNVSREQLGYGSNQIFLNVISTVSASRPLAQFMGTAAGLIDFAASNVASTTTSNGIFVPVGPAGWYEVGTDSDSIAFYGRKTDNSDRQDLMRVFREGDSLSSNNSVSVQIRSSGTLCFVNYAGTAQRCFRPNDNQSTTVTTSWPTANGPGYWFTDAGGTTTLVNFSTFTFTYTSSVTISASGTNPYVLGVSTTPGSNPNTSPGLYVSTQGWSGANEFVALGTTVTSTTGTGAGSSGSPALSINGANAFGVITLVTATTPSANATVLTWTPSLSAPNKLICVLQDANTNTDVLTGTTQVYLTSNASTITMTSGSAALTGGTTYIWNYHCGGI